MTTPFRHRCDRDIVDLSPSKSLYAPEKWRAFAAHFVFGALDGRRIWMISNRDRPHVWAFPERYDAALNVGAFLFVRTSSYSLKTLLEAASTDLESLAFVPDKNYEIEELLAIGSEAFDDHQFQPETVRFEYIRTYGNGSGILWIQPGERAKRAEAVIENAMEAIVCARFPS